MTADINYSEANSFPENLTEFFLTTETMTKTEIKIQFRPRTSSIKEKTKPISYHVQKVFENETNNMNNMMKFVQHIDEDYFSFPLVITTEKNISLKTAHDSSIQNSSLKRREQMTNQDYIPEKNSFETIKKKKEKCVSRTDSGYA